MSNLQRFFHRLAFIDSLIEHYQPEDAQDVQEMLKDLLGDTLQEMLEAEMDAKLGYSKYNYSSCGRSFRISRLNHLIQSLLQMCSPILGQFL